MAQSAQRQSARHTPVCVTGMGIVTSLGIGKEANWAALTQGKSGIASISRFDTGGLRTTIGGLTSFDGLDALPFPVRTERLAVMALNEALGEAGLTTRNVAAPLFLGIPPAEMSWSHRLALALEVGGGGKTTYDDLVRSACSGAPRDPHHVFLSGGMAAHLSETFGTGHAPVVVNTACATGATVI